MIPPAAISIASYVFLFSPSLFSAAAVLVVVLLLGLTEIALIACFFLCFR